MNELTKSKSSYILGIYKGSAKYMKTTIFKLGNSNAVRLTKNLLDELGLKTNDEITIETVNNSIVIRKANTRKNIKELFENYNGKYDTEMILDDKSVGGEML